MSAQAREIAAAIERVERVLTRSPKSGLHDDAPATSRWDGGLRFTACHANGTQVPSDMPRELGGSGDCITPGWLFRAGLASCIGTCIALNAAARGIDLTALELKATSRSDTRGVLGLTEPDGAQVSAGPCEVRLQVRIAARGVTAEALRALVEESNRRSPISCVVSEPLPLSLEVEVQPS
ncbi:MAG TPA: OsmC family protein [Steroidobacteraceae bacterium]|nr:OsmC family protein [Steroidobacteraceae bacterium]